MFTPGASSATHGPKLEKLAKPSLMSVAPTTIALGALDGDAEHASALLLPAATTNVTPAATALAMLWLSAAE